MSISFKKKNITIFTSIFISLFFCLSVFASVCTYDVNGNGTIDPATEYWTCLGEAGQLCPYNTADCTEAPITMSGSASIGATNISDKNGITQIQAGTAAGKLDFYGWQCVDNSCASIYMGGVDFTGTNISGAVSVQKITRLVGNSDKIEVYGCNGNGCTEESLQGSITISGSTITGTVQSSEGLLSVEASGNDLVFTGLECSYGYCQEIPAGFLTIGGSTFSVCPHGSQYVCYYNPNLNKYQCSVIECSDETLGGLIGEGSKICAKDINGDGIIAFPPEGQEVYECQNVEGGLYCAIEAAACEQDTQEPICPEGTAFNPDTDKCEATPGISCPSGGYVYVSDVDTCAMDVSCPGDGSLNPDSDLCEIVVTSDLCPAGYTYDSDLDACIKPVVCTEGGVYNSISDKCEVAYTLTCPSGYTYNSTRDKCEADPVCPSGSSYNTTYNVCLKAVTSTTCPSGYTYNSSSQQCEKAPTCPSGSSYNVSTDRCEMTVQWYCSVNGGTYSSQSTCNSACVQTGTCTQHTEQGAAHSCWWYWTGCYGCNCNCPGDYVFQGNCAGGGWGWCKGGDCMGLPQACQAPGSNQCPGNTAPAGSTYRGCWENKVSDDEGGCNAYFYKFQSWYDQIITYICSLTGTSYSALSTCQGSCSQSVACTSTCPSGYTKSGSLCIANASCSSGGTLNTSVDKCQYAPTYNCDSGYTYDSAIGYCKANATCDSSGTLDTSVDKCQLSRIYSCPADYTYNSSIQICQSDPVCDYGYFDSSIDLCRLSASEICPETYTYNSDQNKCLLDPPCPVGAAYSITLNQCSIDAIYDCPDTSGYSPSTRLCWAYPMCPGDMPYNEEINGCDGGYRTCPYGAYPCLPEPETGIKKCSPNECFDPIAAVEDTGEEADTTSYQNDGSIDEATGVCEGIVYIFNGKGGTCKPSGIQTTFFNCCDTSEGSFLMVKKACGEEAGRTVQAIQAGRCHYVGEYCAKKWKFIGCVQTAKTYCCFNSKLGRIIQEQGRGQLQNFQPGGNWGSAESPNCVGFTPEQFSMIDFSRVDLSEFISDIQGQIKTNIEEGVENKINDYYNNY